MLGSSSRKGLSLAQTLAAVVVLAILATVTLWGVPQWRARSAGTELVAAARSASLGELGTRTFETAPAGGAGGEAASVTSSGGSARVETLARWSEGEDWGVVLTHAWDRRQACVATSAEPTPRCGPVDEIASGGSGALAPSGVTGSLVPLSRAAAESQWPTLLAGRAVPSVPANGGLVVADARALVATPWASMPVAGGSAGASGADTTAADGEQTVWVTWRQGNTVLQSGRASDTTASILVAAVADAETPVELWLVSSSGRVRADGGTGGSGGGGSGSVEPFSISTLTPVAGAPVLLDGRAVRVGTDSSRAWNWVFGTNLVPSSSSVQNIVRFPTAGTFVITLSTRLQSGQVVTQSRTVTVSSGGGAGGTPIGVRPRAVLTASGTFVAPNQAVSMSLAQSSSPATGGISTYRFVSGAGSAQSGAATNFTTVYRSAGTYTALGIIADAAGVVDTARLTITVATGGAPLDGARSSLNVLPLGERGVGRESRSLQAIARVVDINGLARGGVVPTVTVTPLNGTTGTATMTGFGATTPSTGESIGSLTVPALAPDVVGVWELALRTGGAAGPVLRRDTVTFTGTAAGSDNPLPTAPVVGRLAITSDVPQGSPVLAGQPIAPAIVGQLRSLDGLSNQAVDGVIVSVVFQQGNGTLSGATGVTDGTGRVVLPGLALHAVAGSYQLALSADGYVPATTRVFDVLTALEGSRLSVLQQPALTMIRGQTNVVQPSVRLLNADGTPAQIPGVSVAALVASSTARGGTTLTGATATTNGAGVATFSSLRLNGLPGLVTLRFAANGYQPAVARSIQLNAPAPFVSLDTAWSASLRHGQASSATPVITLRDIQDRIVGTAGSTGGTGTGTSVSFNTQTSDLWLSAASATTTSGVARLPDFRAFASRPLSRTVSVRAAGFDSTTFAMNVVFPAEGGASGLKWLLVSGAPSTPLRSGTATGPIVFQLVDASNAPVAASGYPLWLGATGGRTLAGQDGRGRAGLGWTDAAGRVTVGPVTLQGAAGATSLITRGRESFEDGVGKSLPTLSLPVTLLAGAPTTATRSGASTLSATDGTALAPITIQLRDGSGNAVAEAGATVTLTATGGVTFAAGTATATTDASGVATIAAAIPQGLTGTVSLSATMVRDAAEVASAGGSATLTPALGSLSLVGTPVATVESRAPTSFVPSGGTFATTLQVQLRDGGNRAVPLSGVSIQMAIDSTGTSSDEQASAIASGATAVTNTSGVATFSSLVLTGSGTVRLTATAPALASVTATAPTTLTTRIRIAPAPVSALAITAGPSSGTVNVDLASLSVELRDASNGRVPEAGRVVTISLDPTTGWAGTLSGSTSRTTDVAGRVTFTGLRLVGTAPASGATAPRLVASLTGATSATTTHLALAPGRVSAVTLTSAPDTLYVDIPAPVVVQARDVAGNATADLPVDYRLTFGGGGVTNHEGMRHAAFSGVTGSATFTFTPRQSGLTATGPAPVRSFSFYAEQPSCMGCAQPSFTASRPVRPGPARQIVVSQQPTSLALGAPIPSALRLTLQDASGNAPLSGPAGLGTPLSGHALTLAVATSVTPGRTLEAVSGDAADLTVLTDATGVATVPANTLRLLGASGGVRLVASGASLTGVIGPTLTASAATAVALQWVVTPPVRGRIGAALTAMSVRAVDSYGNVVVSPTRTITLEPVAAGYTLTGASSVTTGSGTAGFAALVVSGPRGSLTLRATSPGLTSALAPAAIDLSSGSAAAIALVRALPSTLSVEAGVATNQSLQVQLVDAGGFPVYESGRTLTLNLPGTSSIPDGRVATTNATGLADFGATRVRGAAPSTLVGGTVTDANGLPALSLGAISLGVGAPAQFALLSPLPTTVSPGAALSPAVRAQLRDVSGNATPVAGRELHLFAADGSAGDGFPSSPLVVASSDAAGVVTFGSTLVPTAWLGAAGSTHAFRVRARTVDPGNNQLEAGFDQTTGFTLTVSAGSATQIGILSGPATATVESPFAATDSVIAQIRDADGNAVALSGRSATLTLSDGAAGALTGGALTAVSSSTGRLAFALAGRSYVGLSGARSWTVTAAAGSPTLAAGTRAVTVNPGAATTVVLTTPPSDTAALGLALARPPVVEFRDAGGNRATGVTGVTVTLAEADGQSSVGFSLAGATASSVNGVATFTSLALTGPLATYSLAASAGALTVNLPPIVLGVGPATQLTFVSGFRLPDQLAIGVSSLGETRVQLRDAGGNAAPQGGVSVSATLVEGPGGTLGGTTTRTTAGTGQAAFPGLTLTGLPGSHVIEFSTSTFAMRDTVILPVGLMDATQSTLTATPTTISASDASSPSLTTVTLTAKDNTGTNRPNQPVRIALSGTASSGATAVGGLTGTTDASGVATFSVRTTRAGTLTITGFNNSTAQQMTQTSSVTVTSGAAVADSTLLTLSRASIAPTGIDTTVATITVRDRFLNPVAGATVALTATPSTGLTLQTGGVTNAQGQTFLAITGSEETTTTIGLTVNGQTATGRTASLTVTTVGPGGISGGLETWLRADTGVVLGTGSTVTSWAWRGKSATSASGVSVPTWSATAFNGRPGLVFAGAQGLRVPNVTLGGHTIVSVFRQSGTAGLVWEHSDLSTGTLGGAYLFGSISGTIVARRGTGTWSAKNLATNWATDNTPRVATVTYGGTHASHGLRLNGVNQTLSLHSTMNSNPGTTSFTDNLLLGHRASGGSRMTGALAEIVVFNRLLSELEIQAVEAELVVRWGLNLPTASFTATPGSGLTRNFDASASTAPMGVASYAWDFGDLSTGSGVTTSRTYTAANAYQVTLTVTDQLGRTAQSTTPVNVGGEPGGVSSGLLLWARADLGSVLADGATVSAWPSIVGPNLSNGSAGSVTQGPVFQATGLNGRPTFAFSAGRGLRTTGNLALGPQTIFTVMRGRAASLGASGFVWEHGTSTSANYGSYLNGSNDATVRFTRSPGGSSGTSSRNVTSQTSWATDNQGRLITTRYIGTNGNHNVWFNGVLMPTGAGQWGTTNIGASVLTQPLYFGYRHSDGTESWAWDLSEVVVYNRDLTPAERSDIQRDLANRWGLALPAPTASFTFSTTGLRTITFDASASVVPQGVSAYAWTFGDGAVGTGVTTSRTYATDATYSVTLTVTDVRGQTGTQTQSVPVVSAPGGVSPVGLQTWLRADTGVVVGGGSTVTSWTGQGAAAGAAGGVSAPTWSATGLNNLPAVVFSGTQGLRIPSVTLGAQTLFVVFRATGTAGTIFEQGVNTNTADGTFFFGSTGATVAIKRAGVGATGWSSKNHTTNWAQDNVPRVATITYNGTQASLGLRLNSAEIALTDVAGTAGNAGTSAVTADLFLGHRSTSGPLAMTGAVSEILAFNRLLTPEEILLVETQLASRWQLSRPTPVFTISSVSGRTVSVDGSASTTLFGTISSYAWDFGDLTTGVGATTSRTYTADGTYAIALTVTNSLGISASTTRSLSVAAGGALAGVSSSPSVWLRPEAGLETQGATVQSWGNSGSLAFTLRPSTSGFMCAGTTGNPARGTQAPVVAGRQGIALAPTQCFRANVPNTDTVRTMYVVYRLASATPTTNSGTNIHWGNGSLDLNRLEASGALGVWARTGLAQCSNDALIIRSPTPSNAWTRLRWQVAGSALSVAVNGSALTSNQSTCRGTTIAAPLPGLNEVVLSTLFSATAGMEVAEMLGFTSVLSAGDQTAVEAYLAQRWTAPTASFTVAPLGRTITVNAGASSPVAGTTLSSYAWDFGDGTTATGVSATKTYASDGTRTVTLTVTSSAGTVGTATQGVTVTDAQIVGLFRADSGVVTDASGNVTQWNDLSGSGRHLVPLSHGTGAPQQIASALSAARPAVRFNTRGMGTTSGGLPGTNFTVVAFTREAAVVPAREVRVFLYGSATTGNQGIGYGWQSPTGTAGIIAENLAWVNNVNARPTASAASTKTLTYTTNQAALLFGTTSIIPATTRTFGNGGFFLLGGDWAGDVGEVRLYNRVLSAAEIATLDAELTQRWAPATVAVTRTPTTFLPLGTAQALGPMEAEIRTVAGGVFLNAAPSVTIEIASAPAGTVLGGTLTQSVNPSTGRALFSDVTLSATTGGQVSLRFRLPNGALSGLMWLAVDAPAAAAAIHLDAAAPHTLGLSGAELTSWANRGTLGGSTARHATNDLPTWNSTALPGSRPAVVFGATCQRINLDRTLTVGTWTVFSVWRGRNSGGAAGILYYGANAFQLASAPWMFQAMGSGGTSVKNLPSAGTYNDNVLRVVAHRGDGTHAGHGVSVNGSAVTLVQEVTQTSNPGTQSQTGSFWLGGYSPWCFTGDLGEILVYPSILSAGDEAKVVAYLRAKWGV